MSANVRPPGDEVTGYQESAAYRWTERAHDLLSDGLLQARAFTADGVLSSHVWGPCPRCSHELDDRQVHSAVITGTRGWWPRRPRRAAAILTVDVICACRQPHEGAPGDTAGCGVSFRVELTVPGSR